MAEGVTTGPLINHAAVEKVEEHIQDALAKGAKLVAGGNVVAGSRTDLFRSSVAVAVPEGARKPDIGSEAAFRATVEERLRDPAVIDAFAAARRDVAEFEREKTFLPPG